MKKLIIPALCVLALAGCNQKAPQPEKTAKVPHPLCNPASNMPGGWHKTDVSPEVNKAVELVIAHMSTSAKLDSIVSVHSQVVNGINYAIEFKLSDGQVWHTVVYRSLKGEYTISKPAQQGSFCG